MTESPLISDDTEQNLGLIQAGCLLVRLKADTDQGKEEWSEEKNSERGLKCSDENYASGKVTCCTLYFRVCKVAERASDIPSVLKVFPLLAEK